MGRGVGSRAWPPLAWALLALAGCGLGLAALLSDQALAGPALVGLLGLALVLWWWRAPRRMLIAGLYFLAPIDVSKALVAPLDRFYSPGLYLSAAHVMLLALALLWGGHRLLIERRALPLTRLDLAALAFLAVLGLRSMGTLQGGLATASAVAYGLAVLGFYVASHALRDEADLRLALVAAAAAVGAEFLWVAAQVATGTPLALPGAKVLNSGEMLSFGSEGSAFRPAGFFVHPNALADHMTLVLPPAFALLLLGRRQLGPRARTLALGVLAAGSVMLLLTLSRGGWAAAILGGAWVLFLAVRRGLVSRRQLGALAVAGLAGLMIVIAVYPQLLLRLTAPDQRSTESRLILADQAMTIIRAHPWAGVGYGGYNRAAYEYMAPSFAYVSAEYQTALLQLVVHNHYLLLAAELGVPAMLGFVVLLAMFVRQPRPWPAWRDDGAFAVAAGLSGALLAQALFLASDNFYADIRIFMIWLTAGTLQGLCLRQRQQGAA